MDLLQCLKRCLPWSILITAVCNSSLRQICFGIFVKTVVANCNCTTYLVMNYIGIANSSLAFLLMPFITPLLVYFDRPHRLIMFIAGLLSIFAGIASSLIPHPIYLFITYSTVYAVASSLVYCTVALIVADYYDSKHRWHVLATSLVATPSVGEVLACPMVGTWTGYYGWRAAFMFHGVLVMSLCLFAVLFFHPKKMRAEGSTEAADTIADGGSHYSASEFGSQVSAQPSLARVVVAVQAPRIERSSSTVCRCMMERQVEQFVRGEAEVEEVEELEEEEEAVADCTPARLCTSGRQPYFRLHRHFPSMAHLLANPQIFFWFLERILLNAIVYGLMLNVSGYFISTTKNIARGAYIAAAFNGGECFAFLLGTLLGDSLRGKLARVQTGASVVHVICLAVWAHFSNKVHTSIIVCVFVGLANGLAKTWVYALAEEVCLQPGCIAYPITQMFAALGMVISPLFAGNIIDHFGYHVFLMVVTTISGVRALVWFAIDGLLWRVRQRQKEVRGTGSVENNNIFTATYVAPNSEMRNEG